MIYTDTGELDQTNMLPLLVKLWGFFFQVCQQPKLLWEKNNTVNKSEFCDYIGNYVKKLFLV